MLSEARPDTPKLFLAYSNPHYRVALQVLVFLGLRSGSVQVCFISGLLYIRSHGFRKQSLEFEVTLFASKGGANKFIDFGNDHSAHVTNKGVPREKLRQWCVVAF